MVLNQNFLPNSRPSRVTGVQLCINTSDTKPIVLYNRLTLFPLAFLCSLEGPVKMIYKSYLSDPTEMQERQQQSTRTQGHHKLCSLSCLISSMLSHQVLDCHCSHFRPSVDSLQWQSCQHHTSEDGRRRQSCPASKAGCHFFFWGSGAAFHHHTHPLTSTPRASVSIPSTAVCCAHM